MPYANAYNKAVATRVQQINQRHINTENAINDDAPPNDPVTSQVEAMSLRHPDIVGGSGYAAATVGDLGYEPTMGAEGSAKPKRASKKKGEGIAAAGMGAGLAAAGLAAAGAADTKEGGALLTLQDIDKMHGQPPLQVSGTIAVQAKAHNAALMLAEKPTDAISGGALGSGARKKRNDLVKEIMKSKGLSLPEASKHIKANNLY